MSCCGRNCGLCIHYPHSCTGCEEEGGRIFWLEYVDEVICPIYNCCKGKNSLPDCGLCSEHPCRRYADNITKDSTEPLAASAPSHSHGGILMDEMSISLPGNVEAIEPAAIIPSKSPTAEFDWENEA